MHVEDAATQPLAAPAPGSVLCAQLLRDNLQQGFRDDAIALRDRYILDEVLAVGASCIVYKARDPRRAADVGSSSNFAIKALRPELRGDPGAIERLRREFRFCAALRHPNVVRVYALEEISHTWFMVMEFLDGKSLARLIYDGSPKCLPVTRALDILRACSAVLSLIHERRTVHREFNPGNVWITETGEVRVIGFGASQRCAPLPYAEFDNDENRCDPKLSCASPSAYASPQVLAGERPEAGDDVFSFACIAYELLAGRHPFGRWNAAESGALHLRIERPRGLRWPVWRALRKGLHRRPGRRTRSAADLLLRLERGFGRENAGQRGSVVEAMVRHLAGAHHWFEAQPIGRPLASLSRRRLYGVWDRLQAEARRLFRAHTARVVERAVSLGDWFASRRAELATTAGTARRFAARWPSFSSLAARPPGDGSSARLTGFSLPHISFPRHGFAKIGLGYERATAQAQHLGSVLVSKRAGTMRGVQRVVGAWRETRRAVLQRMHAGKEWVVGARYVAAGAAALALACLTLVDGKSTLTGAPSYAVGATGTRDPRIPAASTMSVSRSSVAMPTACRAQMREFNGLPAPWIDDSLVGPLNDRSRDPATSGHLIALAFGSEDDCALGLAGIPGRMCASASLLATSDVRSSAAQAINRPAHRSRATVALERATLAVSDRAIAAVLVVTRVGAVRDRVMVRWRTVVGTAKPGEDYEGVNSGTARFIDKQLVRVLYVPLKPNPNALGDRSFAVELSRPSSGAELGQIRRVIVTIQKAPLAALAREPKG
jgi:serine/threonine protein kinase